MKDALIIFAKNPVYGHVKTRLAATTGMSKALQVYNRLIEYTASIARQVDVDRFVFYTDAIQKNDAWDDELFRKKLQVGNDLGERMNEAFKTMFEAGYQHVVIIGTDCPELVVQIMTDAFNRLSDHDVVIGPASDGGYYLLGLKKVEPMIFENISWSTNLVFPQTVDACKMANLRVGLLRELSDIDTEDDLTKFAKTNPWLND